MQRDKQVIQSNELLRTLKDAIDTEGLIGYERTATGKGLAVYSSPHLEVEILVDLSSANDGAAVNSLLTQAINHLSKPPVEVDAFLRREAEEVAGYRYRYSAHGVYNLVAVHLEDSFTALPNIEDTLVAALVHLALNKTPWEVGTALQPLFNDVEAGLISPQLWSSTLHLVAQQLSSNSQWLLEFGSSLGLSNFSRLLWNPSSDLVLSDLFTREFFDDIAAFKLLDTETFNRELNAGNSKEIYLILLGAVTELSPTELTEHFEIIVTQVSEQPEAAQTLASAIVLIFESEDVTVTEKSRLYGALGADNLSTLGANQPELAPAITEFLSSTGALPEVYTQLVQGLPDFLQQRAGVQEDFVEALKYLQQDPNRDLEGALEHTFTYIRENGRIGVDSFVEGILEVHQSLGTTGQGALRQQQFVQAVGLENLQELVDNGAINDAQVVESIAALEQGLLGGSPHLPQVYNVLALGLPTEFQNQAGTQEDFETLLQHLQNNPEQLAQALAHTFEYITEQNLSDLPVEHRLTVDTLVRAIVAVYQATQNPSRQREFAEAVGSKNLETLITIGAIQSSVVAASIEIIRQGLRGGASSLNIVPLPGDPYEVIDSTPQQIVLSVLSPDRTAIPGIQVVLDRPSYEAALTDGTITNQDLLRHIGEVTTHLESVWSLDNPRLTYFIQHYLAQNHGENPVEIVLRPDRNFVDSTASYLPASGETQPQVTIVLGAHNLLTQEQVTASLDKFLAFAANRLSNPDDPSLTRVVGLNLTQEDVELVAVPFDRAGLIETLEDISDVGETLSEIDNNLGEIENIVDALELQEDSTVDASFEELEAQLEALPSTDELKSLETKADDLISELKALPDPSTLEKLEDFNTKLERLEERFQELRGVEETIAAANRIKEQFADNLDNIQTEISIEEQILKQRILELKLPEVPGETIWDQVHKALKTRLFDLKLPEVPGAKGTSGWLGFRDITRRLAALRGDTNTLLESGPSPGGTEPSDSKNKVVSVVENQSSNDLQSEAYRQSVGEFLDKAKELTGLDIETDISPSTTNREIEQRRLNTLSLLEEHLTEKSSSLTEFQTETLQRVIQEGTHLGLDYEFFGINPEGIAPKNPQLERISEAKFADLTRDFAIQFLESLQEIKALGLSLENLQELSELELQQELERSLARLRDPNIKDAEVPNRRELLATAEERLADFKLSEVLQRRIRLQEFLANGPTTSTSTLEELQDRLTALREPVKEEGEETFSAEHVEELLTPVVAAAAISDDLSTLEAELNKIAAEQTEITGVEHTVDKTSIDISEEGHVNFDIVNTETGEKNSHVLNTDDLDFQLPEFLEKGHQKLQELETDRESLPTTKPGKTPKVTAQVVSHFTTVGGLVIGGAILAQSIRQLEEGNDSAQAKAGVALGSYFTLHAAYGGYKQFLAPVIARKFGSQIERFSAAAEKTAVKSIARVAGTGEELAAQGLKTAAKGISKVLGKAAPVVGFAVGVYALTEDSIALDQAIKDGNIVGVVQGTLDTISDVITIGLDAIGAVLPEAEIVTAPLSLIVNAIRFILDDVFGFISQELAALPEDASDGQKAVAVLKGIGEGLADIAKNLSPIGAIVDSIELDKKHDRQQKQLDQLQNPDNYFSEEEINGEPAINFNGGDSSYNGGKITFRLAEDGKSGQLILGEVTSADLSQADVELPTHVIAKQERFSHSIHTIVLSVGESHKVHTHTEKAYLFWFIPVHSRVVIDSFEGDANSLVGTYYGNDQDNTFIGLTLEDVGDNADAQEILSHYKYRLYGQGGDDSFLLGDSSYYVEGGEGADHYVVEGDGVRAEVLDQYGNIIGFRPNHTIYNYAQDGKIDTVVLPDVPLDRITFFREYNYYAQNYFDLQIEIKKENSNTLLTTVGIKDYFRGENYRHIQFQTVDGYLFSISIKKLTIYHGREIKPFLVGRIVPKATTGIQVYDATTDLQNELRFYEDIIADTSSFSIIIGNDQDSRLKGSDLSETIIGGDGRNTLIGLGGNDTLIGGNDIDLFLGGSGDDQLLALGITPHSERPDLLYGNDGNDVLVTRVTADLYGGDNDDTLIALAPDVNEIQRLYDALMAQAAELKNGSANHLRRLAAATMPLKLAYGRAQIRLYGGAGNDQYRIQRSVTEIVDKEGANVYNIETFSGGSILNLLTVDNDQQDLLVVDVNADNIRANLAGQNLLLQNQRTQTQFALLQDWTLSESHRNLQVQTQDGYLLDLDAQGNRTIVGYTVNFAIEGGFSRPNFNPAIDETYGKITSIIGDERDNILTGNNLNNYIAGVAGSNTLSGGAGNDILVGADPPAATDTTLNVQFLTRPLDRNVFIYNRDLNLDRFNDFSLQQQGPWNGSFTKRALPENFRLKGDLTNLYLGDFNGDGQSDILRQEKGSWDNDEFRTAHVLLSSGNGSFTKHTLPERFRLKGDLTNLYLGDFNGDGKSDILRQEKGSWDNDANRNAHVLLSSGNGSFTKHTLPERFRLKGDLTNLYLGDFNGDGKSDILRQEKGSWDDDENRNAEVLLSSGNGTFTKHTLPESFALKGDLINLYLGDFNGDGKSDILRQEKGSWDNDEARTAQVLLSSGNGSFTKRTLPENLFLKGDLTNLYLGDFNGDGKSDILRQEKGSWDNDEARTAQVLLSSGNGSFTKRTLPENLFLKGDLTNLYTADFNGDGFDDIFRQEKDPADNDESNTAEVLLSSNGFDSFFTKRTLPETFFLKGDFTNLYTADFNGDGQSDILRQEKGAWDNNKVRTAEVLLSSGNGAFTKHTLPERFALKGDLTNLYLGDFNGDGFDDILRQEKGAWDNDEARNAEVLLSSGNGSFTKITLPENFRLKGDLTNLYLGDFNGDGFDDILRQEKGSADNDRHRTAEVLLSSGNGSFTKHTLDESFKLKGDFTNLYLGDFNGDGKSDILRQEKGAWDNDENRNAEVLLSSGNGTFTKITLPESFKLKGDLTNLYLGDFNGDGKSDILRQEKGSADNDRHQTAEVLLSSGNGSFTKHTLDESLGLKGDLTNLFVKDLDGDGKAEILVQEKSAPDNQQNILRVLFSDDGYTFTSHLLPEDLNVDGESGQLHIADYNGSGQNDILVQYYGNHSGLIGFSAITRNSDGPDNLTGGSGSDTYILNGKLALINNLAPDLATDQIILKAPVSEITTALSSDGDLEVKIGAKTVARVQNWTLGETYQHLEILEEDNYVLTPDSSGTLTLTGRDFSRETESQTYNAAVDTAHPTIVTITGGSGNDILLANSLDNTLIGGAGDDYLYGGTGNDVFFDNLGINIFKGGDGSDIYLIYQGQARNTIDNTATDGADDIAQLQANFADLAARKQGNNLLLDNGESGDTALNLVVKDWFVNDPQNHLQFITKDGVGFSVTADEDPVIEIQAFNFSSSAEGTNTDLALISLDNLRHPHVRLASSVRLQDSPHNDTLKGNDSDNVLISSQGQDYLEGRLGQDVYFVSSQNDPDNPNRLHPSINNYASDLV